MNPGGVQFNSIDQIFVQGFQWFIAFFEAWPWLQFALAVLLMTVPVLMLYPFLMGLTTWVERRVLARIQNRMGPNRTGAFGLLQFIADGIKMLMKEDIVPRSADKLLHILAPVLVVVPPFLVLALLPVGKNMTLVQSEAGLLLFFALSGLGTLAIFMAGWSSRNKFSVLGAMRAGAQAISYEIPLIIAALSAVVFAGSLSLAQIVESQSGGFLNILSWNAWTPWGFAGFLIFFVAGLAEVNRSPFDIPEAESEIVAGHLTEYSGFKYALFFVAEYLAAFAIAGLAVTLFLGGWNAPVVAGIQILPSWFWFPAKMYALVLVMIWIRGTLPRLRSDQLMSLAWKFTFDPAEFIEHRTLHPLGPARLVGANGGLARERCPDWCGILRAGANCLPGKIIQKGVSLCLSFPEHPSS